ncbi:MAG: flagellar motor switch protein FliN [Phycisphaerales bacterium]|nr:flagellar motor switch protein FliN [Phycisphaerales bacterium]
MMAQLGLDPSAMSAGPAATAPAARVAVPAASAAAAVQQPATQAFAMPNLGGGGGSLGGAKLPDGIDLLSDVNLHVKIELGRTRMLVEDVLRLGEGSVVELDKLAGDPVDVYVNDRPVARGEVLVLNDNFCVRINEIIQDPGDGGRKTA